MRRKEEGAPRRPFFISSRSRRAELAGTGLICLWAGCSRLLSMRKVGLPEPKGLWIGYLVPELVLPVVVVAAQLARA